MNTQLFSSLSIANGLGLAQRYGVTKAAVGNWATRYDDFPLPIHAPYVVGIPLWRVSEVDNWRRLHNNGSLT